MWNIQRCTAQLSKYIGSANIQRIARGVSASERAANIPLSARASRIHNQTSYPSTQIFQESVRILHWSLECTVTQVGCAYRCKHSMMQLGVSDTRLLYKCSPMKGKMLFISSRTDAVHPSSNGQQYNLNMPIQVPC